jgi:hypothetical protein
MSANETSLLLRIRGDAAGGKAAVAETRAAVAQLRQSFGPQLTQSVTLANQTFSSFGDNLTAFAAQRIPLVGNAFAQVARNAQALTEEFRKGGPHTANLAKQIDSIAKSSGKSTTEISRFLTSFARLETQTAKNDAAFKLFGGSVDLAGNKTAKFLPDLEQAGASMAAAAVETGGLAASMAGLAGPIAITAAAMAAQVIVVASLTRQMFQLTRATAEYQGKLFDLSQQTGVSVETLSALEVVARTTGGSIEGLTASLGIFQRHLEEVAGDPDAKAAKAFRQLGIDATNTEQALRQAVAGLAKMPEGFRQTALALEVFGRGGKAFLAIAKEANGDIDGIISRLENLGLVTTDQARLADEFNDQLVLLDVQMRGIGTQAIPVFLAGLKDLSKTMEDNRDVVTALRIGFAFTAQQLVGPLRGALAVARTEFEKLRTVIDAIAGSRITFGLPPAGKETPPPEETKDPFTKELEENVKARKRAQNVLNFEFAEQQRQAQSAIAEAQREFESGQKSRKELLDSTLDGLKKQTSAEIEALKFERDIKLRELALAKDDAAKKAQLETGLFQLDTQIADKRSQLRQREADERAKFRQQEAADEIAHQERLLANAQRLDQVNITGIEQQVALRKKAALDGDKEIENIELTAIDREQNLLVKRLEIAGKDEAKSREITDRIKALDQERTATTQRHSQQRLDIAQREADITLQLLQLSSEAQIASIQSLADARFTTEEAAARKIAKLRLDALDVEIELAKARNADTRVLEAQRALLADETERDIDAAMRRDIENHERYADELEKIDDRIRDIEFDTAQEVIKLMRLHFADRKAIIRAQRDLDLAEEAARHQRVTDSITAQEHEVDEQIRIIEQHLKSLKIGTDAEIEQHERLIEELEKLRLKREELKRQQDAEDKKNQTRKRRTTDESKKDTDEVDPFEKFKIDSEDIRKFAQELEDSVVPIGEILANTFSQVADAIGSVVSNWVLLGETGPAVMRKILAAALASIAAEAAVNAIKMLAVGFANLAIGNFKGAGDAFISAALWGSIAGVAAIAGRAVAGDLFKQKGAGGGTGSSSGDRDRGQLNPLTFNRNQPEPQLIIVEFRAAGDQMSRAFTAVVLNDVKSGGPIRQAFADDEVLA